jgi:hypothetical protein
MDQPVYTIEELPAEVSFLAFAPGTYPAAGQLWELKPYFRKIACFPEINFSTTLIPTI